MTGAEAQKEQWVFNGRCGSRLRCCYVWLRTDEVTAYPQRAIQPIETFWPKGNRT